MLGTANKNIGDAFLFVWKLPSVERDKRMFVPLDPVSAPLSIVRGPHSLTSVHAVTVGQVDSFPMADYAVRAFLK